MAFVGAYRGCVALCEAGDNARRRSKKTWEFNLPGRSRHPDAAGSIKQRALFAETARRPLDEMRGVSDFERRPRNELKILFRRDSFTTALQLPGGVPHFADEAGRSIRPHVARRKCACAEDSATPVPGGFARPRFSGTKNSIG